MSKTSVSDAPQNLRKITEKPGSLKKL